MTRSSSGTACPPRKVKKTKAASSAATLSARRARRIIDALLKELQRGLKDPALLLKPEWEQLFGAKQSAVANVQKLVASLAALPAMEGLGEGTGTVTLPPITAQEMELLMAWLAEDQ